MASGKNPRGAGPQDPEMEVLPPLSDWHGPAMSLEQLVSERDRRIVLLELHQRETDHRIKNSLQVVASLVSAQARACNEARINQMADEIAERIELIASIHDLLCLGGTGMVDLGDLLLQLCGKIAKLFDSKTAPFIHADTVDCKLSPECAGAMALVVQELLLNAFKHARIGGRRTHVAVELRHEPGGAIRIVVEDDGGGSPPGSDHATTGVGMTLVGKIADAVGATVKGQATGFGCRYTVDMPVAGIAPARQPPV